MIVGVPKETFPAERRVALTPRLVPALTQCGIDVVVQARAGEEAGFSDAEYRQRGARIGSRELVFRSDVIFQVRTLGANLEAGRADLQAMQAGQVVIGFCEPWTALEAIRDLAERRVTLFALELMPRTSRAQSMDALSSMATVAGYKSVLLAAARLPKLFPMMVTPAGTITPARVAVIGAGVAGLQAIATARRLGGSVHAYDVRPELKEQVESLGARFADLPLETGDAQDVRGYAKALGDELYREQRALMTKLIADSDVVITTAAIPGKRAPLLISRVMVEAMSPGAVIVDLAAGSGGNCELTHPDAERRHEGVVILGPTNLAATVPLDASQMYAKNITAFLLHMVKEGELQISHGDAIVRETLVAEKGQIVHPQLADRARARASAPAAK